MARNLALFALPVAQNAWSGPLDISALRLDEVSELMVAPVGSPAGASWAIYFALDPTLNPTLNGPAGMARPPQLQQNSQGQAVVGAIVPGPQGGPSTVPTSIGFSTTEPCLGTVLFFQRLDAQGGAFNVQVSGETSSSGPSSPNYQQGGNAFGATAVLGTLDNNDLRIITNNLRALTIKASGQVAIGPADPAASAQLDVQSTTGGLLVPRMTTVQRNAIAAPATSLLIWNTTTASFEYFDGAAWVQVRPSQSGTGVLVAGVSAAIPAIITASSRILVTMKDPGAGAIPAFAALDVPAATRLIGAPGSFVVEAIDNTKAVIATAVCTFDWLVVTDGP